MMCIELDINYVNNNKNYFYFVVERLLYTKVELSLPYQQHTFQE